jgi:mono/diheme cytochrome c family protein
MVVRDATEYDRRVSSSGLRLPLTALLLFAVVSAAVFTLAKLHLARPSVHVGANEQVKLGDFYNGQTVFFQKCGACHGQNAQGTKIAPKLEGLQISLAVAKAQIDAGGGVMPAGLVSGRAESDVLAYLATILARR